MNKQCLMSKYKKLTTDLNLKIINSFPEAFYKSLHFSTGGIRALIKHGYSFINDVTVNIVITSLVQYLNTTVHKRQVFVGFDGRRDSRFFAFIAASVFKNLEYTVIMHSDPVITPFVAFMANQLGLGVMITASHNSGDYNGIKIFLDGGYQISSPADKIVESFIAQTPFTDVDLEGYEFCENTDTPIDIKSFNFATMCDFDACLDKYSIDFCRNWPVGFETQNVRKILFSPLYGPSRIFFENMTKIHNCANSVVYYEPHCIIDQFFGGIKYPNPENIDVFSGPIEFADKNNIDIVLVTDPDGDRFGVAEKLRNQEKNWHFYDADEIALLLSSIITDLYNPSEIAFFNTFYCSAIFEKIATLHGYLYNQTETGFKNISSLVRKTRENGRQGICAYEDSLGFLIGNSTEKDAIPCCVIITKLFQLELNAKETCDAINKAYGNNSCVKMHFRVNEPKNVINQWIEKLKAKIDVKLRNETYELECEKFKLYLRVSGTESMVKAYAKAENMSKVDLHSSLKKLIADISDVELN